MSDKRKKIEKYIEIGAIGKETEKQHSAGSKHEDTSVKIHVNSDASASEETPANDTSTPGSKLTGKMAAEQADAEPSQPDTVEQELEEAKNRYMRAYAEFENYKKRSAKEMTDFRKFANETLLSELLSVVDNLERAIDSSKENPADATPIVQGIEMTLNEIMRILEKFHVKPIEAEGQPFDPRYHQAFQQETSDKHPENTVIREFQKGYLLHDRLLRPSMVIVSKKTEGSNDASQ